MCYECNLAVLTEDQLLAVAKCSLSTQNYGMLFRHLRNGLRAVVISRQDVRVNGIVLKAGTRFVAVELLPGQAAYYGGGCIVAFPENRSEELKSTLFTDNLDMERIEWQARKKE